MAVLQKTYQENLDPARAGQIADMTLSNVDTRICKTAAGIGFGLAVVKGTGAEAAQLGGDASVSADFVGITVRDITLTPSAGNKYPEGAPMGVLTEGDIWVEAGAAVTHGQDVAFDPATGALSSDAASTNAGSVRQIIAGARWMTSAAANKLAIVRLTGPLGAA